MVEIYLLRVNVNIIKRCYRKFYLLVIIGSVYTNNVKRNEAENIWFR